MKVSRVNQLRKRGFVMVEVIIAIGLFAVAATALMSSINKVGKLAFLTQQQVALSRLLESHANRIYAQARVEEGLTQEELNDFGDYGQLSLLTEIAPLELTNQDGQAILGLFEVNLTLNWFDGEFRFLRF